MGVPSSSGTVTMGPAPEYTIVGVAVDWFQTRTTPEVACTCTLAPAPARKISALPAPSFSTRKPRSLTTFARSPVNAAAPQLNFPVELGADRSTRMTLLGLVGSIARRVVPG